MKSRKTLQALLENTQRLQNAIRDNERFIDAAKNDAKSFCDDIGNIHLRLGGYSVSLNRERLIMVLTAQVQSDDAQLTTNDKLIESMATLLLGGAEE